MAQLVSVPRSPGALNETGHITQRALHRDVGSRITNCGCAESVVFNSAVSAREMASLASHTSCGAGDETAWGGGIVWRISGTGLMRCSSKAFLIRSANSA